MTRPARRRTDGARILLVEDNDDLRLLMQMALENEGYVVEVARSAEDGVMLMERHRYDLVLTDYMLPARTGVWLLRHAIDNRLLHGAATLLVTADPDSPEIAADQEVVPKPVDFEQFLPQIRSILADGVPLAATTDTATMPGDDAVELVLYVSPASVACARAQRAMREILSRYDSSRIKFQVCDMTEDPESAARDRILFTPTLIKRAPAPTVWVLGDLTRRELVTDLLQMCGVVPAGSIH